MDALGILAMTAVVAHSPRFGGKVQSFDAGAAKQVPGVVDVVQIPTGVAVIAETTYAARKGQSPSDHAPVLVDLAD